MLETPEQKQIFAGSIVLIIILGLISFWHRPGFLYTDTTNYAALKKQSEQKQLAYAQFLASLNTTAGAQRSLFEQVIPAEQLQAEVEKELATNQNIVLPEQPKTILRLSSAVGKDSIVNYLKASQPTVEKIKNVSEASVNDLFNQNGNSAQLDSLIADLSASLNEYSKLSVPKEAAVFESQHLVALEAYLDLAKVSKAYRANPNTSPWPQVYKNYAIITTAAGKSQKAFDSLNQKYNLLGALDQSESANISSNFFIPTAQAQLAVTDIWQKIWIGIQEALAASLARFELAFLDKLVNKIEETYRISNYLYYTDALVSGQYVDDYLNKYVNNALDRTMIKNFIPEISCGNSQNLNQVFQAKADQYLGFDPNSLDPADPQYYQKMARVGDFFSSANGWQLYYQGVAAEAESRAREAANNELNSPANKASRDVTGGILVTAQTTIDALRASLQSQIDLAQSGNAGFPTAAKIASQITQTFLNNFVFRGTVLQEQKTCIPVPLVNLVIPIPLSAAP